MSVFHSIIDPNKRDVDNKHSRAIHCIFSAHIPDSIHDENIEIWNQNEEAGLILSTLKAEFKCKRMSQRKFFFSINRRLTIIWPMSPYECKTYIWIMHTCVHKIDIDHLSLLDFPFIAFFSVHWFFVVCGCIAEIFKIPLETCVCMCAMCV